MLLKISLVLILIGLLGFGSFFFLNQDVEEEKDYQGPVPLGYDVDHFRKTGETIKEVSEDGARKK